jgi:hypothetical protein
MLLRDLEGGFDEEALAAMHDYWNYNHDAIAKRGQYGRGAYGIGLARPRIDLTVFITSKDNLVVEWRPTGMEYDRLTPECDWLRWRAERNRGVAFDSRPSNELLFLHEVRPAMRRFPGMYDFKWDKPERIMIDAILLQATAAMVGELKDRLKCSFEVNMVTDIFTEWEEVECASWPRGKEEVLASWKIENIEERKRRQQLADLERVQKEFPVSLEEFVTTLVDAGVRRSGPPPTRDTKSEKATKALKKAGYSITLGQVQQYRALLEKYRPELFPAPPPETAAADPSGANVVTFKRPNGADDPPGNGPSAA